MLLNRQGHLVRRPDPGSTLDFGALLSAGIGHCQALGGDLWTDYNEHDPGVTTLEQLCYAMTDLAYRCRFPVADLLAEQGGADSALVTGDKVLVSDPLTANDYRAFLWRSADPNIKNVWLEPAAAAGAGVGGLYNLYVEQYCSPAQDGDVAGALRAAYAGSRNLCEDLDQVTLLAPCPIVVGAQVDIALGVAGEQVLADLLYALQDLLVPFIAAHGVQQQLAAGVAPERIYCGPALGGLVIDGATLRPRRTSVALAEAAAAMQAVPGVLTLTGLSLQAAGAPAITGGSVAIADNAVARLAPSIFEPLAGPGPIGLTCQGRALAVDMARVSQLLALRLDRQRQHGALDGPLAHAYATLPAGKARGVDRYVSIQRHFPQTYGIGEGGVQQQLAAAAYTRQQARERIAQARQFKAYLLFFEQILADGGAQLANAGRLLSLDPTLAQGYFWHSLLDGADAPPDMLELLQGAPAPAAGDDGCRYSVQLANAGGGVTVLRSAEFATRAEAEGAAERILAQGGDEHAYTVHPLPNGEMQLLLGAPAAPLAFASRRYHSADAALAAAAHLAAHLGRLAHDDAARARALRIACHGNASITLLGPDLAPLLGADGLTPAAAAAWLPLLLRVGIHSANYQLASGSDALLQVTLADGGAVFARGVQRYATPAQAAASVAAIVAAVQSLCANPALQASRIVTEPPLPPPAPDPRVAAYAEGMQAIVRAGAPWPQGRNVLLDHLLARVNEQFDTHALRQTDPDGGADGPSAAFEQQLVASKLAFLQRFTKPGAGMAGVPEPWAGVPEPWAGVGLGSGRMRGAHGAGRSGLALRLQLLLAIPDPAPGAAAAPVAVVEHLLLRGAGEQPGAFHACKLSVVLALDPARACMPAFRALAQQVLWQNCPAHLSAQLLWLGPEQMGTFQRLYAAWTATATDSGPAQALAAFLAAAGGTP